MTVSTAQKNALLDTLHNRFISLHSGDPGTTGAHEIAGGRYRRALENLSPAVDGIKRNVSALSFDDLPPCKLTHFGFWTVQWGGRFLASWPTTPSPIRVPAGAGISLWVTVGFDEAASQFLRAQDDEEAAMITAALLAVNATRNNLNF